MWEIVYNVPAVLDGGVERVPLEQKPVAYAVSSLTVSEREVIYPASYEFIPR